MRRTRVAIVVALCALVGAVYPVVAQNQQLTGYSNGYDAGRVDAKAEINGTGPFIGGLLLGIFFVGYSVLADGNLPPTGRVQAMNASDDYKRGYMDGYQKEWQSIRTRNALFGWGTAIAVELVIYAVLLNALMSYSYSYGY